MRPLVSVIGLFLMGIGLVAFLRPKATLDVYSDLRAHDTEVLPGPNTASYGCACMLAGAVMLGGAFLRDTRIPKGDRGIARAISTAADELITRYGRVENCTLQQVLVTAKDLKISPTFTPYLYAAFLGKEELQGLDAFFPDADWNEVAKTIQRILLELPHGELDGSHFHESWKGVGGI